MSEFRDVYTFHQKFGLLPTPATPHFLDQETLAFRLKFMREELDEFIEGHTTGNMADTGDALVDLVYVALGTAVMMGLPFDEMWAEVQRANMTKERCTDPADSKRGSALDVIKPPGWTPPQHDVILKRAGYDNDT